MSERAETGECPNGKPLAAIRAFNAFGFFLTWTSTFAVQGGRSPQWGCGAEIAARIADD